jgi:hypothetical protein
MHFVLLHFNVIFNFFLANLILFIYVRFFWFKTEACQHIGWDVDMAFFIFCHFLSAKECVHDNDCNMKLDRCDRLQVCATECLQKLGQSDPVAYFHPLTLLFKGYVFI